MGPGVSSIAVRGDRFYTLEQRGEDEIVASYELATGEPVWRHRDATQLWFPRAGPSTTPGATGMLNALDDDDGSVACNATWRPTRTASSRSGAS